MQKVEAIAKELWDFCNESFTSYTPKCDHPQVFKCNKTFWYPNSSDPRVLRKGYCHCLSNYCQPVCYSYYCQFYKKYGSEVFYTLKKYFDECKCNFNEFNIVSIGCGPCTELLGFLKYYETMNLSDKVKFTGVDINKNWGPIQVKWKEILKKELNISFSCVSDIHGAQEKPNILMLNYVLSHISQYEDQGKQKIFSDISNVVQNMPKESIIVITEENNMNPKSGEKTVKIIDQLFDHLKHENLLKNRLKYQFALGKTSKDRYSAYGRFHEEKKGVFENYSLPETYYTVDYCTGLQNIMVVK